VLEGAERDVSASLLNRVHSRWWRQRALARRGDDPGAARAGEELVAFLASERIDRAGAMAAAALVEGHREEDAGHLGVALDAYRLARTLDPQLAPAWWGEARLTWQVGHGAGQALGLAGRAVLARWAPLWSGYGDAVNLALLMLLAALVTGGAFVLVLLVRHGPELASAWGRLLSARWHPAWRDALGWGVVLAPLAVLVLGVWAILVWAVMLVPALGRTERRLVYGWLVLLALAVPALSIFDELARVRVSPSAVAARQAMERSLEGDLVPRLAELAAEQPDEAVWRLLLAQRIADRYPDRAVQLLRDAARVAPDDPQVRVAQGNVFHRLQKPEAAGVYYREALDLDPDNQLARFNLAKTRLASFEFDEAERLMGEARAVDDGGLAVLEAAYPGEAVADPVPHRRELALRVLRRETTPRLAGAVRLDNPLTLAALAALLAAWVIRVRAGRVRARRCGWCGGVYDPLAIPPGLPDAHCNACHQLMSRADGLAPSARQEQARRIDRHLRVGHRLRVLGHLLWPGLPLVHQGRLAVGLILAGAWAFFWLGALLAGRLLPTAAEPPLWAPGVPFLVLAGLLWLVAQAPGLRPDPQTRPVRR
jgi:tetratricopeptide (TPR) repeat protein